MSGKSIFLLFFIFCFSFFANAQRFVSKGKDTIDTSLGQNWSISLGYSSMPSRFGETSIFADVPEYPLIDQSLPEVFVRNGFHFAMLFHFRENWYWGFSYSNNSVSNSPIRGRDFASSFGLNFGYQTPLFYEAKDYFVSFELGIASHNASRGLVGHRDYNSIRLQRNSAAITPAIRFDVNVYKNQLYLFVQAKYFLNFYADPRIRLKQDIIDEDGDEVVDISNIRFDRPGVEVNENASLKIKHPYEIVIGLRYNFDF